MRMEKIFYLQFGASEEVTWRVKISVKKVIYPSFVHVHVEIILSTILEWGGK
jgi:hypothetical protein